MRLKSWKSRPAAPRMTTRSRDSAGVDELMASLRQGWVDHGVRDPPLSMLDPVGRGSSQGVTGDARRASASSSTRVANRCGERLPRGPQGLARRGHLGEQPSCSAVSPSGESQRSHAPKTSGEVSGWNCTPHAVGPRTAAPAAGRRAASRAPLHRKGPRARRRRCSGSPAARRGRPATGRMPRHRSAAPVPARWCGPWGCGPPCHRGPLPRAGARGRPRASERRGRRHPRAGARVGASHGASASSQAPMAPPSTTSPSPRWDVVPALGHRVPEVAADDVELEPQLGPPLAQPRRRGVGLVLDDEQARHQPSWVPTRAPMP